MYKYIPLKPNCSDEIIEIFEKDGNFDDVIVTEHDNKLIIARWFSMFEIPFTEKVDFYFEFNEDGKIIDYGKA